MSDLPSTILSFMKICFQIYSGVLVVVFLAYGMDVRQKAGARDFVAQAWQRLMKICSFSLIALFIWIVLLMKEAGAMDWLCLTVMTIGTAFVCAAKGGLGKAHTFSGQCLEKPILVTRGIYSRTRNPLYLGVLLCEIGASLFVLHQAPIVFPYTRLFWLSLFLPALLYAVGFN